MNKFVFPTGTSIASQGHLIVWADSETAAPGLAHRLWLGSGRANSYPYTGHYHQR